jgi:glycerol-1-phosphate dehydrogenase [NAD(P)+]
VTTRTVNIPSVLDVASGALARLPQVLAAHFDLSRTVIVTGVAASAAEARHVAEALRAHGSSVTVHEGVGGTIEDADRLEAALRDAPPTLVLAVGGGRPIDVAKLAASRLDLPFVAAPTLLSHDGMSSPVASLAGPDGVRRSLAARMPNGVIIDLRVVADTPPEYLRAGIGDLLSNLVAVADWRLAATMGGEEVDEFAAAIALQSALPVLEVTWPLDDLGLQLVARGLVMSGLAMEVAGSSRPCSGGEHLISHALDQLLGPKARPHGEQVALGVLVLAGAAGLDIERIRALYERIGLPTTLEGWSIDRGTLADAIALAPTTRPGRVTVLDGLDRSTAGIDALLTGVFGRAAVEP